MQFAWATGRATVTLATWRAWMKNYIIAEGESNLIALVDAGMENFTLKGGLRHRDQPKPKP